MQPESASATWGSQGASSPTEPEQRLRMGAAFVAPFVTPSPAESLLATCDPFLSAALAYYAHVLNHYLSRAFAAATGVRGAQTNVAAVLATSPVDPAPYLKSTKKLPLLAMYALGGKAGMRTMHRSSNESRYRLDYVLRGDMNQETHERVAPMLRAAADLLVVSTDLGGLDHYQSGKRVWTDSGADHVAVASWNVGSFRTDDDLGGLFPTLQVEIEAHLYSRWDEESALPFWATDLDVIAASAEADMTINEATSLESTP